LASLLAIAMAVGGTVLQVNAEQMARNSVLSAEERVPEAYRGYWQMEGTGTTPLPAPYAAYLLEIQDRPSACTLLKDKGISRLPLAEGARVKSDGKRLEIRFELDENNTVTLSLRPLEEKRLAGRAMIIERGKEVLNVDVFLVPKLKP